MKKGKLIAYIGIDGSGKTTQANILINRFKKNKKKVVQINAFSYFFLRFLIDFLKKKSKARSKLGNPLLNYERKYLAFRIFPIFALIDNWLFFLTKILPALYKNDYVVSDRFFYDFGPSYLEFGYGNLLITKLYLKFLPRPDFTFWLNLPAKEAFARKKEFNLGFIRSLEKNYLLLFKNWKNIYEIDGREGKRKISKLVFEILFDHKCDLCSSKNVTLFLRKNNFSLWRCQSCDLIFLFPKPTVEDLYRSYREDYSPFSDLKRARLSKSFSDRILKQAIFRQKGLIRKVIHFVFSHRVPGLPDVSKRGKILDVGCGDGKILFFLKQAGWDVYGVDPSPYAVKSARSFGLNVNKGDIFSVKKKNFFDVVRFWHVLEHVKDPLANLDYAFRLLKKDGEIIIGIPNIDGLVAKILKGSWYGLHLPLHLYFFNPNTIKKMLIRAGFENPEIKYKSVSTFQSSLLVKITGDPLVSFPQKNFVAKVFILNPLSRLIFYFLDLFLDWLKMGDALEVKARKP